MSPISLFLKSQFWSRRQFVWLGASAAATGIVPSWPALSPAAPTFTEPGTYVNPIIPGDHPDAGAIRVGNDYYLVHTTNNYTPGLLIWHSLDLVHWRAVAAALDSYYGAAWAPFLCEYRGLFYIYFACHGRSLWSMQTLRWAPGANRKR